VDSPSQAACCQMVLLLMLLMGLHLRVYVGCMVPVWRLRQTTDLRGLSEAWVVAARKYLSDVEDYHRKIVRMLGPKTKGTATLARAAQLMQQHGDLRELLQATIRLPPERCECCCCCFNGIAFWWCCRRRHHCRPQLCCP
jgi:hypothetical protein